VQGLTGEEIGGLVTTAPDARTSMLNRAQP